MSNQINFYTAMHEVLSSYGGIATFMLYNDKETIMFRLKDGKVKVKFTPAFKRTKKRRPGKRMRPKRRMLIVGKVIIPEWTALSKTASSLRDIKNSLTRYNKTLKKLTDYEDYSKDHPCRRSFLH